MEIIKIAQVAHEVIRAYCEALGDKSIPTWENAPEWQKESAMKGVALHIDNPNASVEDTHNSWMAQKVKEGWVYGLEKDPVKKIHPCIVPYDHLPQHQQAKDFIFRQVALSLKDL